MIVGACIKCGKPLSGVIVGNETGVWHDVCPAPTQPSKQTQPLRSVTKKEKKNG